MAQHTCTHTNIHTYIHTHLMSDIDAMISEKKDLDAASSGTSSTLALLSDSADCRKSAMRMAPRDEL